MAKLLDSYTRISESESLEMEEGLDWTKKAFLEQEFEHIAFFEEKVGLSLPSVRSDS